MTHHHLLIVDEIGHLQSYDLLRSEIIARLKILDDLVKRDALRQRIEKLRFEILTPAPEIPIEDYRPQSNEPFYRGLRKYRKKHRQ